ncbi:MAG TPA: hypothetical protein DCQ37_22150, partial [Desulfobacteraceae bacterium]|nr:hypothetical protein [Desulfobacteraceae bacterium]
QQVPSGQIEVVCIFCFIAHCIILVLRLSMSDFQEFENNSMEVALGALGKSIARWTVDIGDQPMTVPPNNKFSRVNRLQLMVRNYRFC